MPIEQLIGLSLAIALIAFLYSSVGHAGASGYIAIMSLAGLDASTFRPIALTLNLVVATITTWQFFRGGHFSWKLTWPFLVFAAPLAFLGGDLQFPVTLLKVVLGAILLFSAARFLLPAREEAETREPPLGLAVGTGAGIALLAGLTGTGGGIFLTPLLLWRKWAKAKTAAATSAMFILICSAAGLLGNWSNTQQFPSYAIGLAIAAALGGTVGSYLGSSKFRQQTIKRILAIVLIIAGFKLLFALIGK
jgi:uncharacterized membrane protein YfcA